MKYHTKRFIPEDIKSDTMKATLWVESIGKWSQSVYCCCFFVRLFAQFLLCSPVTGSWMIMYSSQTCHMSMAGPVLQLVPVQTSHVL